MFNFISNTQIFGLWIGGGRLFEAPDREIRVDKVEGYLHRQCDGVDDDQHEDPVFEAAWSDEPPNPVLETSFRNVAAVRLDFQSKFNAFALSTKVNRLTFTTTVVITVVIVGIIAIMV